jgi:hypothetical protein
MADRPRRRRRRRDPRPAAEVLARFRRRSGAPVAGGSVARISAAWPGVVGATVAAHSAPMRCTRAGVLSVACSSASWAHELTARREDLLARLIEACPEAGLTGIRFAVADHAFGGRGGAGPAPALAPTPSPADRASGEALARDVQDPRLRELVARAAAAAAARQTGPKGD